MPNWLHKSWWGDQQTLNQVQRSVLLLGNFISIKEELLMAIQQILQLAKKNRSRRIKQNCQLWTKNIQILINYHLLSHNYRGILTKTQRVLAQSL